MQVEILMVLGMMSEAQLKTGHFGCYFMRFWFLFKSCVLLGLSVRAYGPPHHHCWVEAQELNRPPLQEGTSHTAGGRREPDSLSSPADPSLAAWRRGLLLPRPPWPSLTRGVGGGLHSTGDGEGRDRSPGFP